MSDHPEFARWSRIYAGDEYYYGHEPGPVARRAVRYARPLQASDAPVTGARALDAGCGEGQDLAFLAEQGYAATGIEWTPDGARKTRRLLQSRALHAEVIEGDLRELNNLSATAHYDLVLSVNALQFMGSDAPACLEGLMRLTSPGGVIGLSLFAREEDAPSVAGTIFYFTLDELLARFAAWQPLEAARLWQWNAAGEPQAFVTLIARKPE